MYTSVHGVHQEPFLAQVSQKKHTSQTQATQIINKAYTKKVLDKCTTCVIL